MENFDLKKYLAENRLLKEEMSLEIDKDQITINDSSGEYFGFIEDNNTVDFSVVYDDEEDRNYMEFDEDNWKDILGPNHAFVKISNQIPTKVEAVDDYVMITVDVEDLKTISDEEITEAKENNKKAIEFVKDKWFKLFDKNGIKLKGYRIGGKVDGDSTLVLFPKTDRDFESISRSLQITYKGNDAYSFKNQKPFEVAGKQYKITYDINKGDGGINITPTTFS